MSLQLHYNQEVVRATTKNCYIYSYRYNQSLFLNFTGCSLTAVMSFLTPNFFSSHPFKLQIQYKSMILYEEKIYYEEKFFSLVRKFFLHSRCTMYYEEKFFFTREKNFSHQGEKFLLVKFKKAICSFIFSLFSNAQIFFCRSKVFQNGSLGSKNGPSDPFKISHFTGNFKIGSSGPFLLPLEPF